MPVHAERAEAEPGVSSPADAAEREAEAVADRVAGDAGSPGPDGYVEPDPADEPWPATSETTRPSAAASQPDTVLASRDSGPVRAPPGFRADLATGGPGGGLPEPARGRLETAFGRSFSGVRLHRDARSDPSAVPLGARAFTWGSDIHLGRGSALARPPRRACACWPTS